MTDRIPDDVMADLVRAATAAADFAAIGLVGTRAERTSAIVTEALRCLLGNGLVTVLPVESWPAYLALDPPYDPSGTPWSRGQG